MPTKSEMLTQSALETLRRVQEDLANGERLLLRAREGLGPARRGNGTVGDSLTDAHRYFHAAAEACRTLAQTTIHAAGEFGQESVNGHSPR